jgi:hypothetical protein
MSRFCQGIFDPLRSATSLIHRYSAKIMQFTPPNSRKKRQQILLYFTFKFAQMSKKSGAENDKILSPGALEGDLDRSHCTGANNTILQVT